MFNHQHLDVMEMVFELEHGLPSKADDRLVVAAARIGAEQGDGFHMRLCLDIEVKRGEVLTIGSLELLKHALLLGREFFGRRLKALLFDQLPQLFSRLCVIGDDHVSQFKYISFSALGLGKLTRLNLEPV